MYTKDNNDSYDLPQDYAMLPPEEEVMMDGSSIISQYPDQAGLDGSVDYDEPVVGPDPETGEPRVEIVWDMLIARADEASKYLKGILLHMRLSGSISVTIQQGTIILNIQGAEPGLVIGHRGQNLDALQHLVNRMANNNAEDMIPITVDSDDYRHRRHQQLERMVHTIGREVSATGESIITEPLTPSERRVFHIAATRINGIRTSSFGDGFFQPIKVSPGSSQRNNGFSSPMTHPRSSSEHTLHSSHGNYYPERNFKDPPIPYHE
jgi:predicted RNA-binding protein Jag